MYTLGSGARKHGPDKRILIVEDDPVSALLLRRILEQRGYFIDHCENGVTALERFMKYRHGVVISDWMMPEMDGVTLTRELRKLGGQYAYIVLLSAKGQRQDRLEAFEAGVDDFLTKPLDRDELFARLKVAERILTAEDSMRRQKEELAVTTDRLRIANTNLILASRRFEELFAGMPVACFTFDAEGIVHEWNRSSEELFQRRAHDAILNPIWRVFEGADLGFWSPRRLESIFSGEAMRDQDWTFIWGARRHSIVCNAFPLRGTTGEILGAICANLDITERRLAEREVQRQKLELEEMNARLAQLAVTDGLTGVWNHRRFREELDSAYASHVRKGWPLSLIMADVDHFKSFNDQFGHPAGDEVLKKFASVLSRASRAYEAVARYGGEEFAIVLPSTSREDAIAAAERFRVAVNETLWPQRPISASFGVATLEKVGPSADELIEQADMALYASKQAGRDRVTHFSELPTATHKRRSKRTA